MIVKITTHNRLNNLTSGPFPAYNPRPTVARVIGRFQHDRRISKPQEALCGNAEAISATRVFTRFAIAVL